MDIEHAFRENDMAVLERHVARDESVSVIGRGHDAIALKGEDYLDKTRDAFKTMKTLRFELNRAERVDNGEWRVSGVHVLKGDDSKESQFTVSFVLGKTGDRWVIREVTADPVR